MRKSALLAICFVVMFAAVAHAELKIAVFDLQTVAEKSDAIAEAKVMWEQNYTPERTQLEKVRKDLDAKVKTFTAKSTDAQKNEFRKEEQDFAEKTNAFMRKMQISEQKIRGEMDTLIVKAAASYAAAKGYNLVLDTKSAPYYDKTMDVTDDMIKEANRIWNEAKATPKK